MNTKNKVGIIGCGWLGFSLAQYFIEKGYPVNGSTTSAPKMAQLQSAGIAPFLIKFPDTLQGLSSFLEVDTLIINIPPGRKNPAVETDYPKAIATLLEKVSPETNIVFVSSTSVYGGAKGWVTPITERIPNTASGRALVKIENDLMARAKASKNKVTILRPGGLVGGNRHPGRFLAGRKNIKNGDAPINLIHRDDVIQCIYRIVEKGIWNEAFNLSADLHPVKKEYYTAFSEALQLEPPTFMEGGEASKKISNEKIKNFLQLELKYPDPLGFPS